MTVHPAAEKPAAGCPGSVPTPHLCVKRTRRGHMPGCAQAPGDRALTDPEAGRGGHPALPVTTPGFHGLLGIKPHVAGPAQSRSQPPPSPGRFLPRPGVPLCSHTERDPDEQTLSLPAATYARDKLVCFQTGPFRIAPVVPVPAQLRLASDSQQSSCLSPLSAESTEVLQSTGR